MMVPSLSNKMPRMAMALPTVRDCNGALEPSGGARGPLSGARVEGQVLNGGRSARQRVGRVPGNLDLVEARAAGVIEHQPSRQSLADPQDLLQDFGCLQRADDPDGSAQHAHLGAV